jgi:hypothetical protein
MKTITFLLAILVATGLNNSQAQDSWTKKSNLGVVQGDTQ